MISFIKKQCSFKKGVSGISISNPLFKTNSDLQVIKETLLLHDTHIADIHVWECPVCYDTVKEKNMFVCFPFQCNHITCFKCLTSMCEHARLRYAGDIRKKMKCSLCRAPPNTFWDQSKSLSYYKGVVYKRSFHLVLTRDL